MKKNENVKETLEAGVQTKRHSEGIRPKNPLHILKRFFAKCKFPFAGNCVRPAQNDGKILTPLTQDPTPKSKISTLPQGAGIHVMHLFTPQKTGLLRFAPANGFANAYRLTILALLRMFALYRNDVILLMPQCLSNLVPFKKLAAFTLAEVLITLGVIGVVAAMTIPNLITAHQKKAAVAGLLEAQSIINQALKMYTADTDEDGTLAFDTSLSEQEFAEKYFKPYLKVARVCTKMEDGCWKTGDFYGYYDLAGNKKTDTVPYSLVLNNGMILGFNKSTDVNYNLYMIIADIDGHSAKNVMGHDVFAFYLYNSDMVVKGGIDARYKNLKNGVYPGGFGWSGIPHVILTRAELLSPSTYRSCNKMSQDGRAGVGTACAALIYKDGWEIKSDYPW